MFWADKIAESIVTSGKYRPLWIDDMFTPSGHAHVGSLRGPLVHDIIYRAIKRIDPSITFTYVFNDFDPIDGLPSELMDNFKQFLGFPLRTAPSPVDGFDSFGEYFSNDFKKVLRSFGVGAKFLSSWDLYHEGKFNEVIKKSLDSSEKILDIYHTVSGSKKKEKGWLPLQVICEKCGKLGTTRVYEWDGKKVKYICEPKMVVWAIGCGYQGEISPYDGNGKLPWKVDWPAHWSVLGVTVEGAGKDHSSAGGSRDIAREIGKHVFHIPEPFNLPYEFFLIGGKKMASSKGLGIKGKDLMDILPPEIARFLFTRTDFRQSIEFDPVASMAIPDLFDEYDRSWKEFLGKGEDILLIRAFELSQIKNLPEKKEIHIPRFRDMVLWIQQPNLDPIEAWQRKENHIPTTQEKEIFHSRMVYVKRWIDSFAPDAYRYQMTNEIPHAVSTLSPIQKKFLVETIPLLQKELTADQLQLELYTLSKNMKIQAKDAFGAIYISLLGKTHGPKAAWILKQYSLRDVINRFEQVVNRKEESKNSSNSTQVIHRPDLFSIHSDVQHTFPSIHVGIAVIRNVTIKKTNPELEIEKSQILEILNGITNEKIGKFPEIVSYRKLYKQMGVDWHSRRPSPEALLRRISGGKGLYTVNTCVDAYNLIVLKHHISIGAFDFDQVKFPTCLQFAHPGDSITLLGESVPTVYKERELAYYDRNGGYNIDFNYRDAKRTSVSEDTKNLWINIDGVCDITPEKIKLVLDETITIIQKYCNGQVEFSGIVK